MKKRRINSPKKAKKSGLIYFFLIPVLFLALYVAGQPQTFIHEASSDKEKKVDTGTGTTNPADGAAPDENAVPTFTSLGDCTATQSCPTGEPAVAVDQAKHEEKKDKKSTKTEKASTNQQIQRIQELLKQITNGKCEGLAEKLGANSVASGENDIEANRWHRRKQWKQKKRGLYKLLKCLQKATKQHQGNVGGETPQEPVEAPVEQPQDQEPTQAEQPTEAPATQEPTEAPQASQAPAGQTQVTAANVVTGDCGTVISKAQQLNDTLQIGSANGSWSNQPETQSDCNYTSKTWAGSNDATKYWCTYLIVDAYNLAGFKGLSVGAHAAVVTMRSWWKTASGYKYVENKNDKATMDSIGPGYAIFMEIQAGVFTGKEHVNFIKTKNVDDRGNGTIDTLDSNAKVKGRTYTVTNWTISGTSYPVRGFGGH